MQQEKEEFLKLQVLVYHQLVSECVGIFVREIISTRYFGAKSLAVL